MSYEMTSAALSVLNTKVSERYAEGHPLPLSVMGRPQLHIISLKPLVYERYGTFRNRAPQVAGELVLREFLWHPGSQGGAVIYTAMEAGSETYGFRYNPERPDHRETLAVVAESVGLTGLQIVPVES